MQTIVWRHQSTEGFQAQSPQEGSLGLLTRTWDSREFNRARQQTCSQSARGAAAGTTTATIHSLCPLPSKPGKSGHAENTETTPTLPFRPNACHKPGDGKPELCSQGDEGCSLPADGMFIGTFASSQSSPQLCLLWWFHFCQETLSITTSDTRKVTAKGTHLEEVQIWLPNSRVPCITYSWSIKEINRWYQTKTKQNGKTAL